MASIARFVAPLLLVSLAAACGGRENERSPRTVHEAVQEDSPALTPPAAASKAPITSLRRAAVKETIAQGLGVFLRNVTVEDWPVMHQGKFHGFTIRTINSDWMIDLKPGDVVTRVNGVVPEHPEDADAALRSLEKETALRVDFERNGQARTLELPIVD